MAPRRGGDLDPRLERLWRAVDQHGVVLDILVQSRRDAKAAKRLLCKLMKRQERVPRVLITDKLRSYGVAARTRRRERIMKRFKSPGQAQRFLATHDQIADLFRTPTTATADRRRQMRQDAHSIWADVAKVAVA